MGHDSRPRATYPRWLAFETWRGTADRLPLWRAITVASRFAVIVLATALGACGSAQSGQTPAQSPTASATGSTSGSPSAATRQTPTPTVTVRATPPPPPYPVVLGAAHSYGLHRFIPVAMVNGHVAAWLERAPAAGEPGVSVTVVRFDQRLVRLVLHAGASEPGGSGWPHGDAVGRSEVHKLLAAFNGGFRFSSRAGGFVENGRVGARLQRGAASVVTYATGVTDIGAWRIGVPASGLRVASVRQNLTLLINHGRPAGPAYSCRSCWGDTLGGATDVARGGLGITARGQLVWAAGAPLSVAALAHALLHAGATRALELDINPAWVAGYFYIHHHHAHPVTPLPLLSNQTGVSGFFLAPDDRDFFTIIAR